MREMLNQRGTCRRLHAGANTVRSAVGNAQGEMRGGSSRPWGEIYILCQALETQGPHLSWRVYSPQPAASSRVTADCWSFPIRYERLCRSRLVKPAKPMHPCVIWRLTCLRSTLVCAPQGGPKKFEGARHPQLGDMRPAAARHWSW